MPTSAEKKVRLPNCSCGAISWSDEERVTEEDGMRVVSVSCNNCVVPARVYELPLQGIHILVINKNGSPKRYVDTHIRPVAKSQNTKFVPPLADGLLIYWRRPGTKFDEWQLAK